MRDRSPRAGSLSRRLSLAGQPQLPPALDELGAGADGADEDPDPADPPAVNEVTAAVTSLPAGETSHHLAPKLSLP